MIFQKTIISLNPVHIAGDQIIDAILIHKDLNKKEVRKQAINILTKVVIHLPKQCVNEYPN